jgi:hypothetical protein
MGYIILCYNLKVVIPTWRMRCKSQKRRVPVPAKQSKYHNFFKPAKLKQLIISD